MQDTDDQRSGCAEGELGESFETRFRELVSFGELIEHANSGLRLDEVLENLHASFRRIIPYDRMSVAFITPNRERAVSRWTRSTASEIRIPVGYSAPLAGSSLAPIIETGEPRILNDLRAYAADHPDSDSTRRIVEEGMGSSLTCPLIANGTPVGFLFFTSTGRDTYRDADKRAFMRIATQLSLIIEKGRLYEQLSERTVDLEKRNEYVRAVLARYVSDDIAANLLSLPENLEMGGERRRITMLMSDLRDFSSIAESHEPELVIAMLNHYLGEMTEVIVEYGGTINEFIGDCILVLFGAPVSRSDHARRAVRCSISMQIRMAEVNRYNRAHGLPALAMGIAVHTGHTIVGNIGSPRRSKYGVVGTAVNLTSRIESAATGGQILVSDETRRSVRSGLLHGEAFEIEAVGYDRPVRVTEILGCDRPEPIRLVDPAQLPSVRRQLARCGAPKARRIVPQ